MRRSGTSAAERRACAQARADAERASGRGLRRGVFIGVIALVVAMIGAMSDPHHRLNGFLFGGLGGIFIGVALLAWPTNSDYPSDYIDKTLD